LYFTDAPHWDPGMKKVSKIVAKVGESVTFTVHVLSNPPATMKWFKGPTIFNLNNFIAKKLSTTYYVLTSKAGILFTDYGVYSAKFDTGGLFPVGVFDFTLSGKHAV
jgi:hypothetical protein